MRGSTLRYGKGGMDVSPSARLSPSTSVSGEGDSADSSRQTSVKQEDSAEETRSEAAAEERLYDFGLHMKCGRERVRSARVISENDEFEMSHKTPIAPVESPLSTTEEDDAQQHDKMAGAPIEEGEQMVAEDHLSPAAEARSQLGDELQAEKEARAAETSDSTAAAQPVEVKSNVQDEAEWNFDTAVEGPTTAGQTGETATNEPISPAASKKASEPQPFLLSEEIIEAVATAKRKQFKEGDVAAILDPNDLSKALLIPFDRLDRRSNLVSTAKLVRRDSGPGELCCIFVLDLKDAIPTFRSLDLKSTREDPEEPGQRANTPVVSQKLTRSKSRAKVKVENEDEDADSVEANKATRHATRWVGAYRTLFQIIDGSTPSRRLFDADAGKAADGIQDVAAIAQRYGVLELLRNAFNECMLGWIGNCTLYPAIHEKPVSWLDIGMTLENPNALKEAFIRCAGLLDSFPNFKVDIHPKILESINAKVAALKDERRAINYRLRNLALVYEVRGGQPAYVSFSDKDPVPWAVRTVFTEWMRDHLGPLPDADEIYTGAGLAHDQIADVQSSARCEHAEHTYDSPKDCLTLGGFYRLVGQGGEAYLPIHQMVDMLEPFSKAFPGVNDEGRVQMALRKLKDEAKRIVLPLATSRLANGGAENVEYLTCVKVEEGDYPWEVKVEGEESDVEW